MSRDDLYLFYGR